MGTEEETLALVAANQPRIRVAEAYATNDRRDNVKRLFCLFLAFLSFLFLSTVGTATNSTTTNAKTQQRNSNTNNFGKNLRNKAENLPSEEVQKVQNIINKLEYNDERYHDDVGGTHPVSWNEESEDDIYIVQNDIRNQEDLEDEVDKMFDYIDMAEEDEIDANNSMLSNAVKTMDDSIKYYLGKVFGLGQDDYDNDDDDDSVKDDTTKNNNIKLTEDQLDAIAKKISERLEREAKLELKSKADSVKEEKVKEVKQVLEEDKKMNTRIMEHDIQEVEDVVLEDLKDEIHDVAARVKDSLPEKVKSVRNEVVLEMTGKKLDDIEKAKQAKKEKKQEIVKKFEEIQQKNNMMQMNNQARKDNEPVGESAQVDNNVEVLPAGKNAQIAKEKVPVDKNTNTTKVGASDKIGTQTSENSQAVIELDNKGETSSVPAKTMKSSDEIGTQTSANSQAVKKADVLDLNNKEESSSVQANAMKMEVQKSTGDIDNNSYIEKTPHVRDSEDTETTSTSSTAYEPSYESALRDGEDDEGEDDDY